MVGIYEIALVFAPLASTLTFMPQVIKTFKDGHARDLSLLMLIISTCANIGWLIIGLNTASISLTACSVMIIAMLMPLFYFKLELQHKAPVLTGRLRLSAHSTFKGAFISLILVMAC